MIFLHINLIDKCQYGFNKTVHILKTKIITNN